MPTEFEELLQALRTRSSSLGDYPSHMLDGLTEPEFDACIREIKGWSGGSMDWVEQQALHCASLSRKLALLNVALNHATSQDQGYAASASSGGEGMARMLEINEPGYNPEADRIRRLIRRAIMG